MIQGPKVTLVLQKYTESRDSGGAIVKTWTAMRKIKGVLACTRGAEYNIADRETLHSKWQFWCNWPRGLDISEKDEFSRVGTKYRYRIVFTDNILEMNSIAKIDLIQIQ